MTIEPYRISIQQDRLDDLERRLASVRWPDEIDNGHWQRGTSLDFMHELIRHWRKVFDWRKAEERLNELPHFRTEIDGLGIHFVHRPSAGSSDPVPLIATHGWPSTFVELTPLLDTLPEFEIILPSLPGFGFSDIPTGPFIHRRVPELWVELMRRLGHERFAAHGGDLGGGVTARLGMYHPERLLGIHITNVYGQIDDPRATEPEQRYLTELAEWERQEGAYEHLQQTRPQTLAFALRDSPVGLAAWIVEKLRAWSDCRDDLTSVFSLDDILTTVSIYWLTGTIESSFRPYWDHGNDPDPRPWLRVDVPTAVAIFPADISQPPREFAERSYRVEQWTEMPRGGHFAAFEQPELLAQDIRRFFASTPVLLRTSRAS
jgi:pimeloyl-ACP methyl ester carboxylesterase